MKTSFEAVWERIQKELVANLVVKNWGWARGFSGNIFKVVRVTDSYVICDPPKAKNNQNVPKDDFKKIWEVWDQYLLGKIKRYEIRDICRYSSYIISIYHHLGLS